MQLFSLEHGKWAYRADFFLYGSAAAALAMYLVLAGPRPQRWEMAVFALLGLAGWTLIEYALHRFVLHGLRPFSEWHTEHHRRPTALIYTPTALTAAMIVGFVFMPALLWIG